MFSKKIVPILYVLDWASLVARPAVQETRVQSLGWKDPLRRKWQPILVFLLGKFHEQRSLAGYSLWSRKESDMTEATYTLHSGLILLQHTVSSCDHSVTVKGWCYSGSSFNSLNLKLGNSTLSPPPPTQCIVRRFPVQGCGHGLLSIQEIPPPPTSSPSSWARADGHLS